MMPEYLAWTNTDERPQGRQQTNERPVGRNKQRSEKNGPKRTGRLKETHEMERLGASSRSAAFHNVLGGEGAFSWGEAFSEDISVLPSYGEELKRNSASIAVQQRNTRRTRRETSAAAAAAKMAAVAVATAAGGRGLQM